MRKNLAIDLCTIAILLLPSSFFLLTTQTSEQIISGDNAWYLNRAYLHLHGIFDQTSIYNPMYPLLVGIVDMLLDNRTIAAMVVNAVSIYIIVIDTYLIGRMLYNRVVAWLAVLFISTSTSLYLVARLFQPHILFIAMLTLCVLSYLVFVKRPNFVTALLLGVTLTIALYSRFEGVVFGLLILVAALSVFQTTKKFLFTLRLMSVSLAILVVGVVIYLFLLVRTNDPSSSSGAYAILIMLKTVPFPSITFSARFTDLLSRTFMQWPLWCWLIVLTGVIWSNRRFQNPNKFLASLIIYNMVYIFILGGWVERNYLRQYGPYFSLLLAASVYQLVAQWPRLRILVPLTIMIVIFPGLIALAGYTALVAPLSFENSKIVRDNEAIDTWLTQQNLQDTPIYTDCRDVLPFSHSSFHLIYRLANNNAWNNPAHLLPEILKRNELFMDCSNRLFWPDWNSFLTDMLAGNSNVQYPETLQKLGQVGDYIFYRIVNVQ